MQKITIKELVDFRRKSSDKSKASFALKLKTREVKMKADDEDGTGGGDYWITSTSCICNVFKRNDVELYDDKIAELENKIEDTELNKVKSMHQRNLNILEGFKEFSFEDIRPARILKFETVQKMHKVVNIDSFPLYLNPSVVFSHERNGKKEVGAVWFIAKLGGYRIEELGLFCEMLCRFLGTAYSDVYQISSDMCVAIDTVNGHKVSYKDLEDGNVPLLLQKTLDEIKELN